MSYSYYLPGLLTGNTFVERTSNQPTKHKTAGTFVRLPVHFGAISIYAHASIQRSESRRKNLEARQPTRTLVFLLLFNLPMERPRLLRIGLLYSYSALLI